MAKPDIPEAALALWLSDRAAEQPIAFIARSETRLDRLARACAGFCAGRAERLVLPPWDVLPYDRVTPSAAIVGQRVATLERLAAGSRGLLLTSGDAVLQRVPPRQSWAAPTPVLTPGGMLDRTALRGELGVRGYRLGETVSEPGEVSFRDHVVDLFPAAAAMPVRIEVADGRIASMHAFDPASQLRLDEVATVALHRAVEFPLDPGEAVLDDDEALAPLPSGQLAPVFDYLAGFELVVDDGVAERWGALRDLADDAFAAARQFARLGADPRGVLPRPNRLYLTLAQAEAACAARVAPTVAASVEAAPRRVAELVRRAGEASTPVVVAAPGDPARLAASLARRGVAARATADRPDAIAGGVACLDLDIADALRTEDVLVLPAGRLVHAGTSAGAPGLGRPEAGPRVGDVVVHLEHGAARLAGLEGVAADGVPEERIALAFQGGTQLLAHVSELDRIWRYGAEGSVDRVNGEAWRAKRAEIEAEIAAVAGRLAEQAAARAARTAPAMDPERAGYDRLARRFAYTLSADQQAAVDDVLGDLRRGSPPMDRLVCGDVGFGKTEVALRAAAAAALSGYQVAVVAPTTVLARQHLDTFQRRFAGSGVRVEALMQATTAAGRATRQRLADGSAGIVVGTQGLASGSVRFARLGLVVIDEEQRLGEAIKRSLSRTHTLAMTATPIPRTLQAALVGLREVSVIATAPVRRQPTRTFVLPFDPVVVRDALLREQARGGQSFVVCPRVADLAPVAERLAELTPGLRVVQAHGRLKPEVLERAVVGFAGGDGDVLLATDIIEAGLDIPRANTIVVMHADRFGLAQLHQLRGRVGRGGRRGAAYLLTEPGRRLAAATRARLHALEAQSQLGAGAALSLADLDQRGAGDMFGAAQAGHVSVLGTELYQHLLMQAVAAHRGEPPAPPAPELHVGLTGCIPVETVREPDLRLALYHRLARLLGPEEVDAFAEEFEDRFGELPGPLLALLSLARLRCVCVRLGVARLEAGPRGATIRLHDAAGLHALAGRAGGTVRDDRIVLPMGDGAGEGGTGGAGAAGRVAALMARLGPA